MPDFAQFVPGPALLTEMTARANGRSLGLTAKGDLERYYALVATTLARLRLTEAEASLIADALNGCPSAGYAHYEIEAAIDEGLATKWQVDGPALLNRIADPFVSLALADAAERYWALVASGSTASHRDMLIASGLLIARPELPVPAPINGQVSE